ncbi:GNAT family N-acetyltransferase [Slackia faecicanis]|uniref:GNAT family N-acetyltransferase n=1 Tax=Slackia faecicanis TaxID=255723 RepID=A0A3N0AHE8_9ACTN|nr:GNAT family N-acetyltransferase [Slackia faecicanis]MDO5357855.1 GNAT family N-acetyltransferase [Slackia faecicanis]RNL21485.1 GNAT family N-acetyltransferase [Slackia faecicanis]
MKMVEEVQKSERTDELIDELALLWRRSVTASHWFLSKADVDAIEPEVRNSIRDIETLYIARTDAGHAAGFAGASGVRLEMIFVEAALRGNGYGSALMDRVIEDAPIEFTDVNEGNPNAIEFYSKKGFRVMSRSSCDDAGRPYPVLHMRKAPNYGIGA